MPLLQRAHVYFVPLQRGNAFSGGPGRGHGGDGGNAACNGGASDGFFIEPGLGAVRCVHHKLHAVALDQVDHVGAAFLHFVDAVHGESGFFQTVGGAVRGDKTETHFNKAPRQFNRLLFVTVDHADKNRALRGQSLSGGKLCLGKRFAESIGRAHDFAGGFHFRTQDCVHAGELVPGEDRGFDEVSRASSEVDSFFNVRGKEITQLASGHEAGCNLGQRNAGGFRNIGYSARSARVDFNHENFFVLDGELNIHQPDDFQRTCQLKSVFAYGIEHRLAQAHRGQHTGRVAGVYAGFFNVLHDSADHNVFAIRERVHVNFNRVFQKMIDQNRPLLRIFDRLFHVADNAVVIIGDHHGASAKNVGWPHEHRVSCLAGTGNSFFHAGGNRAGRLRDIEFFQKFAEAFAVFCKVNRFGRSADDRYAGALQWQRQVQRRLPAELHDHADRSAALGFMLVDREYVFKGERLKVEAITGVIVGRDRFRIAVDHDGFVTIVVQREGGVAAAVVKLNALANSVGAAAQDEDFPFVGRRRFV